MSLSSEDTEAIDLDAALWNLRYVQFVGMLTDVDCLPRLFIFPVV